MAFVRKVLGKTTSAVFTFVEIIISLLLSFIIFPVVLIIILPNEIFRLFINVWLRIKFGPDEKFLAVGTDNFAVKRPGNARISIATKFYKTELEVENCRELFLNRVINYKTSSGLKPFHKLTYIFTDYLRYGCWTKDKNFDIKNHVRYYPGSENRVVTESELMEKILPELFADMDDSVPQWEEVIIPKFQYDVNDEGVRKFLGDVGVTVSLKIFRYHHGFMDGVANSLLWATCMCEGKFPYPYDPLAPLKVPVWRRFIYKLSCFLLGATTIIKSIHINQTNNSRFATKNYSGKRIFSWSSPIDISLLHEIRAATKCSVPAIMAAAIGGALRKLHQKYPPSQEKFKKIPNEEIAGIVTGIFPYPDVNLRNRFSVASCPINTSELFPLQRLQLASEEMAKLSSSPSIYINYLLMKLFGKFPTSRGNGDQVDIGFPINFSNLPMTNKNVKLWGNEVVEMAGWPPLLVTTGLGILTNRYGDHMRVCGVTDTACLSEKELKYLVKGIHMEVIQLAKESTKENI